MPGRWIVRASGILAGVCLALIVGATSLQVACRYLLGAPLRWPEEFSRLMFVWMTYGGCLLLPHLRQHISVEFLYDLLPRRARVLLDLLIDALGAVFFVLLAVSGFHVTQVMAGLRLPALQYPINLLFGFVTLAAVAHAYLHVEALAVRLVEMFRRSRKPFTESQAR